MSDRIEELMVGRRDFIMGGMGGLLLLGAGVLGLQGCSATSTPTEPALTLPELPFKEDALEPYISRQTLSFHYGKHHKAYVEKTKELVRGAEFAGMHLVEIVKKTADRPDKAALFNNAAQAWNHNFYWKSLAPGGGGKPEGEISRRIDKAFGSYENFKKEMTGSAMGRFGSGWAWLVADEKGLKVISTSNADTPIAHGQTPLLTIDVWEHAYYLDYQNRRADYVNAVIDHLLNWKFAESHLPKA
ncbi:MAG: superoxide dismutase [Syntrophobacteraceae bacterium]